MKMKPKQQYDFFRTYDFFLKKQTNKKTQTTTESAHLPFLSPVLRETKIRENKLNGLGVNP